MSGVHILYLKIFIGLWLLAGIVVWFIASWVALKKRQKIIDSLDFSWMEEPCNCGNVFDAELNGCKYCYGFMRMEDQIKKLR